MKSTPEQNKARVLEAFDTLFNKRDYAAAERFWSESYIQHSAHIPPGRQSRAEPLGTSCRTRRPRPSRSTDYRYRRKISRTSAENSSVVTNSLWRVADKGCYSK
jgi:predicted SnoaL-like aldol condensation-catalyzing enzyme